ncbi:CoA-binding protein [Dactylosporangium sp. AC04546]|uniref:CoA-binding protein n=1 Tax=Dactylosporangium sp. AC04546 TaxID=2862460 RepID=UPI001EDCD687|nr:CoA-binding protein [Dactylosporangium sp. AC04546]WVK84623.1 CoA-binding protein [Dactylosporangium sp. AC04546]
MRSAEQILREATTIAVVGASRNRTKTAHAVPLQIQRHGWRIIPVNPFADEIFGVKAYRTLADIPEPVDLVNVFRPSADATQVVKEAIAIGAPAVWLQQDIVSAEGRALAAAAGIDYVEDTCIAVIRAVHAISAPERPRTP